MFISINFFLFGTNEKFILYNFLAIKHIAIIICNHCVLRKFVHWRLFLVNKGAKILTVFINVTAMFYIKIANTYK